MDTESQTEEEPDTVSKPMSSDYASIECLDVGAGTRPHPDATVTLDIGDYDHLDFPGVDITSDIMACAG